MSRTWLSIRVDPIGGGGQDLWPRPGRILAASRSHTFAQLASAVDDAFAHWDRARLHQFHLAGGVRIARPDWDDENEDVLDGRRATLARLKDDEQFVYEFEGRSPIGCGDAADGPARVELRLRWGRWAG